MLNNQNNPSPNFTDLSWRICLKPREVVRAVVDYDPWYGQKDIIIILSATCGLLALPSGIEMVFLEFLINLIILLVSIYSMALLLWLSGRLFGGHAKISELCAAMVWPMVPSILGNLIAFPLLSNGLVATLIQLLSYLFSFHLMVETVAEVEGFGAWRSFFSQMVALILSALPLLFFWSDITRAYSGLSGNDIQSLLGF